MTPWLRIIQEEDIHWIFEMLQRKASLSQMTKAGNQPVHNMTQPCTHTLDEALTTLPCKIMSESSQSGGGLMI